MTSEVILQRDRLASLVDNNVASTTSATSSSRQQSVQQHQLQHHHHHQQQQQIETIDLVSASQNNNSPLSSSSAEPLASSSSSTSSSTSSFSGSSVLLSSTNPTPSPSTSTNSQCPKKDQNKVIELNDDISSSEPIFLKEIKKPSSSTTTTSSKKQSVTTTKNQFPIRAPIADTSAGRFGCSSLATPPSSQEVVRAKKFKKTMGNDIEFINDSGIPMEGVELDSSTVSTNGQVANSTTNSTNSIPTSSSLTTNNNHLSTQTSSLVTTITSNRGATTLSNEAIASDSPALSWGDESKCSGNFSPEFGSNNNAALAALEAAINPNNHAFHNNHERNSLAQSFNYIRNFGDLFDDDDLD